MARKDSSIETVFLIGAARSGTKFLRDIFSAHPDIGVIPYDINFTWRRGNEDYPDDEMSPELCRREVSDYLRSEIPRKGRKSNSNAEIIVEKTVSNTLRIPFLLEAFPKAKFVILTRDGKPVVESAARVWTETPSLTYRLKKLCFAGIPEWKYLWWYLRNMMTGGKREDAKPVWGPRYRGIEDDLQTEPLEVVCARQWVACNEAILRDQETIPEDQKFQIRYEELVSDSSVLEELCDFIGLKNAETVLSRYGDSVESGMNNKWEKAFSASLLSQLSPIMNPVLSKLGYTELRE